MFLNICGNKKIIGVFLVFLVISALFVGGVSADADSIVISSVSVSPNSGDLNQSVTLSATVTGALSYQWQQQVNNTWSDISGATTNPYTQEFSFNKDGRYFFRLAASDSENTIYSSTVTYTAGNLSEGMLNTWISFFIFLIAVILFIVSAIWLYHGTTLAIIPMVASPIITVIITAISAFGKVGEVSYISHIVDNQLVKQTMINTIPPALVLVYGFISLLMVVLTIYILAQVVVNLRRNEEYSEYEYEG